MITIGLTGGIGMGKSTTAALFAELGIPVWDADSAVHRLYAPGGRAVEPVSKRFPAALSEEGGIDRLRLAEAVLGDPDSLGELERIVHPLVGLDRMSFLQEQRAAGEEIVLLDIPLLFERKGPYRPDIVVVCSAPEDIRKARVMERPGMTEEKYAAITAAQMPEADKKAQADYIVPTGEGIERTREEVVKIVEAIRATALDGRAETPQD